MIGGVMNPLLKESSAPFEAFDFSELKVEHFIPALEAAIKEAKENLEKLKLETDITFDNIILKEETSADRLDLVCEIFYALHSAHCTDELSAIAPEFNEKLTSYASDVSLDSELFAKIKETYDKRDRLNLSTEQKTVLENSYQGYVRNGALLNEKDKEKLIKDLQAEVNQVETYNYQVKKYAPNSQNQWEKMEFIFDDYIFKYYFLISSK